MTEIEEHEDIDEKTVVKQEKRIVQERQYSPSAAMALVKEGVTPLLAKILASRAIRSSARLGGQLKHLHHHSLLKGAAQAADFLFEAIQSGKHMTIIADYDCDGATACAVGLRGLRGFDAQVDYVVPDRMVHGYGLTPGVVELAKARFPDTRILITVDNGIASHAGVQAAVDSGLEVLVTDHHLPASDKPLPNASVIVDPSQPLCQFPSKALAGVGVIWYVLWALQDLIRTQGGVVPESSKVSNLLPLVAVGTVADVVPLDENNRILVQAGLNKIRQGHSFAGIDMLATTGWGNRTRLEELVTSDIAFGIGPRINAAGRLKTMDVGIECLTVDDPERAKELAEQLNNINQERKSIEQATVDEAVELANERIIAENLSIAVLGDDWHPGVIGIVAGRIKDQHWRPTFVLASDPETGEIKGSGRSIIGFNLKDALDQLDKAEPGLLLKFGGHAMAAGVTVAPGGFERFRKGFEAQARLLLDEALLAQRIEHDGSLSGVQLNAQTAREISGPPWGQLFPEPCFCDEFHVLEAKLGGTYKDQLKLILEKEGMEVGAVRFRHEGSIPGGTIKVIYKLARRYDKWGNEHLHLLIDHIL